MNEHPPFLVRGYAAIGLVTPKCEANVGGALRAATAYGAKLVILQGPRYRHSSADTKRFWRHSPLLVVEDLWKHIPYQAVPVAVEIGVGGHDLVGFAHPERAFYIFGPEDGSVPSVILENCKNIVFVPTLTCMNLAATVNVVLYDRIAKQQRARSAT